MSAEQNKATARRLYDEVWNAGKLDLLDELLAPDFVDHSPPGPGLPEGVAGAKVVFGMFRAAFPDIQFTVEEQLAEGDRVVNRLSVRGTHQGDLMGLPPSGKAVSITGIEMLRLEGGRIVERWGNFDQLGMLQQIGVAPSPG